MDKDFSQCRMCLHDRNFRKSHLMPAALWAGAREPGLKNPSPVVVTATVSKTNSRMSPNS